MQWLGQGPRARGVGSSTGKGKAWGVGPYSGTGGGGKTPIYTSLFRSLLLLLGA